MVFMSATKTRARKLANWLIQENQNKRSWRAIASDYPEIVKPGTLCRIAKSGGTWLPKDCGILSALGLKKVRERKPRTQTLETIIAMSQMVRQGLRWKRKKSEKR